MASNGSFTTSLRISARLISPRTIEKLRELQRLFYIEAVKYNVLPLDNTRSSGST
ncbi:MAG: hypothetical protein R3D01_02680 [Hyphomicrobiales bacterium]